MKLVAASTLALLLLAAAPASAIDSEEAAEMLASVNAHPAECARLNRQIGHYMMMYQRADTMNNDMWRERMGQQVVYLQGMQEIRCPGDVAVDEVAEAWKQLLKLGAQAAIAYFTFGAGGFPF